MSKKDVLGVLSMSSKFGWVRVMSPCTDAKVAEYIGDVIEGKMVNLTFMRETACDGCNIMVPLTTNDNAEELEVENKVKSGRCTVPGFFK